MKPIFYLVALLIVLSGCKKDPDSTPENITDRDGNTYTSIKIGSQTWMTENLKTTKYNDGTVIPLVTDGASWGALLTPGYCWYDNDAATNKNKFGALYNWYTVNSGKLCPNGWHVPNDADWTTLTTYLGGESVAGEKLKENGTSNWESPNTGATNTSDFTALAGGGRNWGGTFVSVGNRGYFWSSSEYSETSGWYRYLSNLDGKVYRINGNKQDGFSVRCLQD
jgi:uncharacterized protein (TIGR02145 family)